MNPFRRFLYQFELLQLENYEINRYVDLIKKTHGTPQMTMRQNIVWTVKARVILLVSLLLHAITTTAITVSVITILQLPTASIIPIFVAIFFIFIFVYYIFLIATMVVLFPIDRSLKFVLINQAKRKLAAHKDLIVIGISGSYGKTTMKQLLTSILAEHYTVLQTPASVNTPVGIASVILHSLTPETQIFVVEMGEHYIGDIKELCKLVKPSIGVITGINESHLERLGTIENTIATIFELAEYMQSDGLLLLNADDNLAVEHYKKYVKDHVLQFYSAQQSTLSPYKTKDEQFDDKNFVQSFTVTNSTSLGKFETKILGHYIIGDIIAGIIIGQKLGLSIEEIKAGISKQPRIPHRLEPTIGLGDVIIIDDSYNGNPQGVKEAILVLSRFTTRRKVYLTPGLVEMGAKSKEIHYNIGKQLTQVADLVILIRNSVTGDIKKGLLESGFAESKIMMFDTTQKAHGSLKDILKPNDVILFQNDWTDNYL